MSYLIDMERQLRWDLRSFVAQYPFFLTLARLRYPKEVNGQKEFAGARVISHDTDMVIEGFPRSGNTFAVTAFKMSQSQPVKLANHLHAPAQVKMAVKQDIPTLVLIRKPEEAAVSFIIQHNCSLTGRQVFEQYLRFYRAIAPIRDKIVIAPFQQVITDFGRVIHQINQKFDTRYELFKHNKSNEQRCFEIIERDSLIRHQGRIHEKGIARPSESRQELKQRLQKQLQVPELQEIRNQANALYNQFVKASALQPA